MSPDVHSPPAPEAGRRGGPGPSMQILIGLGAGLAVGLVVGERAAVLRPVADVYIRLMQMTVLPYLVLTLVGGLGRLDAATARRLGARALLWMAVVAGIGLAITGLMPLAFPRLESASFYSDALIEPRQPFALGEIYVPANPFQALANAVVPGIVLFSLALGIALIGVAGKEPLLASLRAAENAVVAVTRFVLRLTPYGVFAISAAVAGTIDFDALARLEVYFVAFAAAALLLAFVVLPLVVAALTPFGVREVLSLGRDAMITAFVASSTFIVLPMVIERVKAALAARAMDSADAETGVDVVVPLSFIVPNAGKLLTLLFVPYAMWLSGMPIHAVDLLTLVGAGVPSYFAKAQVALPFLLDLVGAPHDLFQLYIPSSIVTGKFDSMVSVMSLIAVALLTASALSGQLRWQPAHGAPKLALAVGTTAATVLAVRLVLAATVDTSYHKDEQLRSMHLSRSPVPALVLAEAPPPDGTPGSTALERIRGRGVLRVGIVPDRAPFSFVNARGELVGMDIELAEALARDFGLERVEFVPAEFDHMRRLVAEGRIDLGMGMPYVGAALRDVSYSAAYLDGTLGLLVPDADRDRFASVDMLRGRVPLTIGLAYATPGIEGLIRASMPGVNLRFVALASPADWISGKAPGVDAVALLAETGAAWSILHPAYSVVVPKPDPVEVPVGIAMRRGDRDLHDLVDDWLVVMRSTGELRRAREYWVLGRGAQPKRPRWSVMDDLFGSADPPATPAQAKR